MPKPILESARCSRPVFGLCRDLRRCLNLPKVQLEKALKDLESRKLVKTVKSVSQANKKIYMLYNIQPAPELSGGPWFNENHDYDTECIRIIYQQVTALVKDRPNLSSKEICEKLNDSGLLNEKLTVIPIAWLNVSIQTRPPDRTVRCNLLISH